jgi:hypothetical protein
MRRTATLSPIRHLLLGLWLVLGALLACPHSSCAQGSQGAVADSTELRVLRQLFTSTNGSTWRTRTGWPATAAAWDSATIARAGTWQGVIVRGGDIVELKLIGNQLVGSLPASFGQLSLLQGLYLQDNQLTGPLPASMAQLTWLNQCDLSRNQFSGPLTGLLDHWTNLQSLALSHNRFTGPVPSALGALPRLTGFGADDNQLTGPLPAALGNSGTLQSLNLSNNQLTGSIPGSWGRLGNLRLLFLSANRLSGPLSDSLQSLRPNYFDVDRNPVGLSLSPQSHR